MWYVKGAIEVVLSQCTTLPDGSPLTSVEREHYESAARDLGLKGLRGQCKKCQLHLMSVCTIIILVVAMAKGARLTQLSFVGLVSMWDPPRAGVGESISTLLESGVDVKMITGDGRETGETIGKHGAGAGRSVVLAVTLVCVAAQKLGIWSPGSQSLSGDQVETLPEHELSTALLEVMATPTQNIIILLYMR